MRRLACAKQPGNKAAPCAVHMHMRMRGAGVQGHVKYLEQSVCCLLCVRACVCACGWEWWRWRVERGLARTLARHGERRRRRGGGGRGWLSGGEKVGSGLAGRRPCAAQRCGFPRRSTLGESRARMERPKLVAVVSWRTSSMASARPSAERRRSRVWST
jgi:hypothetical protein